MRCTRPRHRSGPWRSAAVALLALAALLGARTAGAAEAERPNIVILFADDMGYGDLSCYGHARIDTPRIDGLADQGVRFTSFYTGSWCVPSRTQLLTGRYMPRVDFNGHTGAGGNGGLPDAELTLAEALKNAGYDTGMAGKWHLGYKKDKHLPPNQGFDSWFGLPYSNDYRKPWVQTDEPLALFRGTKVVEHPINQNTLTTRYTEEAVRFIDEHSGGERPFFFYLAYNMPHLPIHTAERFRGQSEAGLYGDVIETIDWSVGRVLDRLKKHGIEKNTIVFFASDNGPWINMPPRMRQAGNERWHAGNPGPLRGAKGTSYEGGPRVPAMIRWPGHVRSGVDTEQMAASPDIYRTLIEAAGAELPDHPLDGHNLMPFLSGETDESPRNQYAVFRRGLEALRVGDWKLRLAGGKPQLFNLRLDVSERYNRADEKPKKVEQLRKRMEKLAKEVGTKVAK